MDVPVAAEALIRGYPQIYFCCHRRHVRDPKTGETLSRHQASVLDHLDAVAPTSVSALAAHMGVSVSTMSLTLDRLEASGHVRRSRDRDDSRRVGVRLTAAGERVRSANSVLDPALVQRLVASMTDADRARAIEGLSLLATAAARLGRDVREEPLGDAADSAARMSGKPMGRDASRKSSASSARRPLGSA